LAKDVQTYWSGCEFNSNSGAVHFLDIFLLDLSFVNAIVNTIFAMIFGLLIGYIYQETDSILRPILMHSCLNGLSLLPL